MSGWVAQRECARCDFSGAEVEFSAVGLDDLGNPFVTHRDTAGPFDVIVCRGCAEDLSKVSRQAMARAIVGLMRKLYLVRPGRVS